MVRSHRHHQSRLLKLAEELTSTWVRVSGTWAAKTYYDFASVTDGIIFHNALASSDYGFLKHSTFEPRPNDFAVLLWDRLMGQTVYASGEEIREGAHVLPVPAKTAKKVTAIW